MLRKKFLSISSYTLLAGLIVLFLLTHSPNYTQFDAPSYINFDPIRPPLYPIFLWLFHWVGHYQFTVVVWIHAIITFLALLYTRSWLRKNLNINDFLIFIVLLFTILTICFHFQFILIGSEGLVFPFFIWTFFAFIECFKKFSIKKIIYLSLWVSIMILTRLQFYYFYGIYILLCGSYIYKKIPLKSLFIGILILSMSTLLTYLIDSTYHYFKHGFFGGAPATGLLISVQPLFLANDNEINNAFKDPKEKKYVQAILAEINQQQLNKDANLLTSTKLSYYQLAYESYNRNYPAINTITGNILSKNTPTMISKISLDIAKKLFLQNPQKNLLFLLWKFIVFIGGVPLFLFFLIITVGAASGIFIHRSVNYPQLFVVMIILITFLNAATIALFEINTTAYFCYTQFLFYCLAAYFSHQIFFNRSS